MSDKTEARTLKGFRDYLPQEQRLRLKIVDTCREVFELYGFLPLDTPALEYADVLENKIGEDEKLIYKFEDRGGRAVALRYDLTVPLARVVAQYQSEIKLPFRRYQVGPAWRAENPQKGRFREFMQADADIVGVESLSADAECIAMYNEIWTRLGIKNFKILINFREVFEELAEQIDIKNSLNEVTRIIDKVDKMGLDGVKEALAKIGLSKDKIEKLIAYLDDSTPLAREKEMKTCLGALGVPEENYKFNKWIARGLDYYTGTVFETRIEGSDAGSVGGGGRYDSLVESFLGKKIPAVGVSVGVDRVLALMLEQGVKIDLPSTKVLIINLGKQFTVRALEVLREIRSLGIPAAYY